MSGVRLEGLPGPSRGTWPQEFTAYAIVTAFFLDLDIEFDLYQPALAIVMTKILECSISYAYRSKPPMCAACQEEQGGA